MNGHLICCLSGLPIEKHDYSIEHYVAKSRILPELANLPGNIFPAIKIINNIKGNLIPCEWHELRVERLYSALIKWKLKPRNKKIIISALQRIESEPVGTIPCNKCILRKYPEECVRVRNDFISMPTDALELWHKKNLQR